MADWWPWTTVREGRGARSLHGAATYLLAGGRELLFGRLRAEREQALQETTAA